jgi:GntR family transcriptional regulator
MCANFAANRPRLSRPGGRPAPLSRRGDAGAPRLAPAPHRGRRFLYEDVARELRRRVARGVYSRGSRIPSESELVREFHVSAITVRRALRDLALEGLLFARQGLGVFVASARRITRSLRVNTTTSIGDEIRRAGVEPGIKELALALIAADPPTSARLRIPAGSLIYHLERVVLADGEPVGLDSAWLPRALGERFEFLMPLLVRHRIRLGHVDFQFEGGTVSDREASLLALPVGFPLLVVDYTAFAPGGAPILTGRTASRADRFTYEFCAHPASHGTGRARRPAPQAALSPPAGPRRRRRPGAARPPR